MEGKRGGARPNSGGARPGAGRKKGWRKPEAERKTRVVWARLPEPLYAVWLKLGGATWLREVLEKQ
jgi:hypothetical protein